MPIDASLSRAARGLLDWSQADLAREAKVGVSTIADFERGRRVPMGNNMAAIEAAFARAGIEFLNHGQPGVRLRKVGGEA